MRAYHVVYLLVLSREDVVDVELVVGFVLVILYAARAAHLVGHALVPLGRVGRDVVQDLIGVALDVALQQTLGVGGGALHAKLSF